MVTISALTSDLCLPGEGVSSETGAPVREQPGLPHSQRGAQVRARFRLPTGSGSRQPRHFPSQTQAHFSSEIWSPSTRSTCFCPLFWPQFCSSGPMQSPSPGPPAPAPHELCSPDSSQRAPGPPLRRTLRGSHLTQWECSSVCRRCTVFPPPPCSHLPPDRRSSTLASEFRLGRHSLCTALLPGVLALGPPTALPRLSSCVPAALFSWHSFPDSLLLYPALFPPEPLSYVLT